MHVAAEFDRLFVRSTGFFVSSFRNGLIAYIAVLVELEQLRQTSASIASVIESLNSPSW